MPTNTQMESCVADERGSLVFWSPNPQHRTPASKVQIIDVFSLQVVTGYIRDPQRQVASELICCLLAKRQSSDEMLWGVIVETDAYFQEEPACNSYRN